MKRLGVIADIHGNLPALKAVIADPERRHVDAVIDLGALSILSGRGASMPARGDDLVRLPHLFKAGPASADHAILDLSATPSMIEALSLPYDHESAARRAEQAGCNGLAHAARTGSRLRCAA